MGTRDWTPPAHPETSDVARVSCYRPPPMPRVDAGSSGMEDDTVLDPSDSGRFRLDSLDLSVVVMSPRFSATYRLARTGEVTIGRSKSVEIYVDDHSVSRNHAILSLGPRITLRDVGSSNGTRVGGVKLDPDARHELKVGDSFTVGSVTILIQPVMKAVEPRRFWSADDLMVRLDEECARAKRLEGRFSFACLRVDRDAMELGVRQSLAGALRSSDVIGQTGASEYGIIWTDSTTEQARDLLARITTELASHRVQARWGIVEFPRHAETAERLLAAAHLAMTDVDQSDLPRGSGPVLVDPAMLEILSFVKMLAAGDLGVLILGETGVGKEVIAEQVHRLSKRASGPFLRLNCGALSETLLESELFGHEKGAFTSAEKSKPGLIETAAGGTVFLDEVGELPISLQVKLLRVIEDKQAIRVGGVKSRPLDVRFVAATNRDLEQQAARGLFRQDLYYRLAGATVTIPPLRDRPADIEPLVRRFLANAARQLGTRPPEVAADALSQLRAHRWPGNVRELRNVIERAALICGGGPITVAHLPTPMRRSGDDRSGTEPPPVDGGKRAPTRAVAGTRAPSSEPGDPDDAAIVAALAACGGNQSRAAKQLGLSRGQLIRRLERIGAVRPRKRNDSDA